MKLLMTLVVLLASVVCARAQYVTYNHDAAKMNQVKVMETGTGALSPDLYYSLLHNKYKKSASAKNKLSFRTQSGIHLYNQVDEAKTIDTALVKRAEIEALNMADRQVDIAWQVEGDKVNKMMERFRRNIDRIVTAGGSPSDKTRWTEYYRVYECALSATRDAYMPNAQRKKEYLRIYEDVSKQNEQLVHYIVSRHNATLASDMLAATDNRNVNKASIAANALGRWNSSRRMVRGSQGGGSGGDGDETVGR